MSFKPGDVILVWDRFTRPQKDKLHICVCIDRRLFLRINTRPLFPPHMPIKAVETDFLEHDSYVELNQLVRHFKDEIDKARHLGSLSVTVARRLCLAVDASRALSQEHKDLIRERLCPD